MVTSTKQKAPPQSILDLVRQDPRFNQNRSVDWFKAKINQLGGNSPSAKTNLLNETKHLQSNFPLPGTMCIFSYDPKYKEELEYYDKFPCSLIFDVDGDGFTGLNLHYMPYKMREVLFKKVWMFASQYHNNKQQVMRLNWKLFSNFSKFPEAQFTVKRYLFSHVRSRIIKVPVEDWATAIYLPVESFSKKSMNYVVSQTGTKVAKSKRR
jgi:hypothetical protein